MALFCHSYGSVVCGVAAHELPRRVTDVVVAGSPGMRAENVAGLHTSARVWATRDEGDWIADVPHLEVGGLGHGADPVSPEFGARLLSSAGARSHTGYFAPGTGLGGQLRQDRNRRVRFRCVRDRGRRLPTRNFRGEQD